MRGLLDNVKSSVRDKWSAPMMMVGRAIGRRAKILDKFVEVSKDTIRRDGKPLVFFMGAEYCPYCAAAIQSTETYSVPLDWWKIHAGRGWIYA
jgi:thiol-disulfide isomerase/thioredoxin